MKKYRVHGYVQAGQHRWKLVEKVVEIKDVIGERGIRDAAIGAWLMELELDGRIAGSPYQTGYQNIEKPLQSLRKKLKLCFVNTQIRKVGLMKIQAMVL